MSSVVFRKDNLHVVSGISQIVADFKELFSLNSQYMYYNTRFCIGDYYASTPLYCNSIFEGSPVMALLMVLHEHQTTSSHELLFKWFSSLNGAPTVTCIANREQSITNAVHCALPESIMVYRWNHIMSDGRNTSVSITRGDFRVPFAGSGTLHRLWLYTGRSCRFCITLFLAYVHNTPVCIKYKFVDDLATIAADKDTCQVERILQNSLDSMDQWSKKWDMSLNAGKTKVTLFANTLANLKVSLAGMPTEQVSKMKYLGVWLDEQLLFDESELSSSCEVEEDRRRSVFVRAVAEVLDRHQDFSEKSLLRFLAESYPDIEKNQRLPLLIGAFSGAQFVSRMHFFAVHLFEV